MKRNSWVVRIAASLGLALMLGTGLITGGNTPKAVYADDPTPTPTPTQGGNGQPGGGGGGGGVRLMSTPTPKH